MWEEGVTRWVSPFNSSLAHLYLALQFLSSLADSLRDAGRKCLPYYNVHD